MGLKKRCKVFLDQHPQLYDRLVTSVAAVKPYVPPLTFITIHYTYFISITIVGTLIFWGASSPDRSISWWDSMFMVMSALTATGLNTVNVSQLTTFQQAELLVLMMMGSQVLVSYFTVAFRMHFFEKRFEDIVELERSLRKARKGKTGAVVRMTGLLIGTPIISSLARRPDTSCSRGSRRVTDSTSLAKGQESFPEPDPSTMEESQPDAGLSPPALGSAQPQHINFERPHTAATTSHTIYQPPTHHSEPWRRRRSRSKNSVTRDGFNLQSFIKEEKRNIGRHGQFFNLNSDQREYLGGVEYRCLKFLSVFVLSYFVLWQFFGAIALGAWMAKYEREASAVNDQNPWWAGIFLAISAYSNAGFTLLDAGFLPFQSSYYVLTVVTILSLAGPAAFPVFVRLIIWIMSALLPFFSKSSDYTAWQEGFDYILKFPRRVYTSMFPARDSWMFIATFGGFVAADWLLILILGIGNPTMEAIPLGRRIFISLFEGFSIPSGGYAIVSPSSMYFDVQVLWLVIFYTAAYPHIITMRRTNVYEERSLGIYEGDETENEQLHSSTSSLSGDVDLSVAANSGKPSIARIKKLGEIGRRGTTFVGRQVQRRMTAFQGVGVASGHAPLRRAATMDFGRATSVHSLNNHPNTRPPSLIAQQVRGQLSHDVWWIALALFLVTLIETSHSKNDPITYSVFNILFEIVSGYTTIGISIGLPDQAYSFSGGLYTGSKIVMILVMLRGRHRGLPVALDRAVKLPKNDLKDLEEGDGTSYYSNRGE